MSLTMKFLVCVLVTFAVFVNGYIREPGPRIKATKGEIWPQPRIQDKSEQYFVVKPESFEIVIDDANCSFLKNAATRYGNIIKEEYEIITKHFKKGDHRFHKKQWLADDNFLGYLTDLHVALNGTCNNEEYPSLTMDESYTLDVNAATATLSANSIWGVLRGLESFSQSIYLGGTVFGSANNQRDDNSDLLSLRINKTTVTDYPRFQHRGLLVDTSRHFIPTEKLLENLDAMAINKLNVFHWHIVDDESFPYVSKKFPELSANGAYSPFELYPVVEVQEIIEYARQRGIRVIVEFDSPGHTRSWGEGIEGLLTACGGEYSGSLGPVDPSNPNNYDFLKELFGEIQQVFPDNFIHLGGDEVGFECWQSNENITKFMADNNIETYEALESYYIQNVVNIVNDLNSKMIVWEEVFENNVAIPEDTIVQVWISPWDETLYNVVASGRQALLSSCWYLDHLQSGGDWEDFYQCEPYNAFNENDELKNYVLGGEACMWSEVVNKHNLISRVWPRASAVAERLWSDESVQDIEVARRRLEEHTCRMNRRGVGAQPPTAAGYCLSK